MASALPAVTMAMASPSTTITTPRSAFFNPMKLPTKPASIHVSRCIQVKASSSPPSAKDQAVAGLTAAALAAALVIPDVAEAAQPGISPSLKNFLLSIVSGGVVIGVIIGAVIGVSNFDPVKRS
ncbi:uncharacterized protein [Typha angustifolia]|uniref:uncharacterized protein n=1 Tax=Typha angustifolia TaxID=59011 RepID=UPI003C2B1EE8